MKKSRPKDILDSTSHRPFGLPRGPWLMYQHWDKVVFLHWKVDRNLLIPLLPKGVSLDLFMGEAWVSIVVFRVQDAHPRFVPPIPGIADFNEINLRTYVTANSIPGVTFLDIRANNLIQVLANRIVGLPYKQAPIERDIKTVHKYAMNAKNSLVDISYIVNDSSTQKSELDKWLTERYCSYQQVNKRVYRYPIHHFEWPLKQIQVKSIDIQYDYKTLHCTENSIDLAQYSEGVSVLFWLMEAVGK